MDDVDKEGEKPTNQRLIKGGPLRCQVWDQQCWQPQSIGCFYEKMQNLLFTLSAPSAQEVSPLCRASVRASVLFTIRQIDSRRFAVRLTVVDEHEAAERNLQSLRRSSVYNGRVWSKIGAERPPGGKG